MMGRVNRAPGSEGFRFGSRISRLRSGSPFLRRAMTKRATAIVVATTVMNTGNNSKNSTMSVGQRCLPRLQVLVTAAGVEQHDGFTGRNFFRGNQFPNSAEACASLGCPENAFEPRHFHACG